MSEDSFRYEISATVGPCSEQEADALADAIVALPEAQRVGAAVGWTRLDTPEEPTSSAEAKETAA